MINARASNYVYLAMQSGVLSAERISELMSMEPDRAYSVGDPYVRDGQDRVRSWTSWRIGPEDSAVPVPEQLDSLLAKVKVGLMRVRDSSDEIIIELNVVQRLTHLDTSSHGVSFSASWLELLGTVGGSLEIDQYVSLE